MWVIFAYKKGITRQRIFRASGRRDRVLSEFRRAPSSPKRDANEEGPRRRPPPPGCRCYRRCRRRLRCVPADGSGLTLAIAVSGSPESKAAEPEPEPEPESKPESEPESEPEPEPKPKPWAEKPAAP